MIEGVVQRPVKWSWDEFLALPAQDFVVDISCVTTWTKLDTRWHGVSLDVLFEHAEVAAGAQFVTALCYGGYTTNVPLPDVLNGQAFVAYESAARRSRRITAVPPALSFRICTFGRARNESAGCGS